MDHEATESRTRALRSQRARATAFACPDVAPGVIAMTATAVVQGLTGRADVAIVFRCIGKTLRTEERTVLAMDAVTGPHIRSDAAIRQPLQELPISVRSIGGHRFRFLSSPLGETGEHVLCGHRLLTHPCCRRLHAHD